MSSLAQTVSVGDSTGLLEAAGRKSSSRLRYAPWFLTLLVAASAGFGGYYLWQKFTMSRQSLSELQMDMGALTSRAAASDDQAMAARAELAKLKSQLVIERERIEAKSAEASELAEKLSALVSKDQGELVEEDGKLTLHLVDRVLFRSGEADLTEKGMGVLKQIGEAVKDLKDKQIWVQGHTDNVPISDDNEVFESNWELSAARALNVVHFLQDESGVSPRRLAAAAFGQHRPLSRKHKQRNRRIEIVLLPLDVKMVKN